MPTITDPAEEFADVCKALSGAPNTAGANWLAEKFGTEPWSREFYQVLFAIVERGYYLIDLVGEMEEAAHIAPSVQADIKGILQAFSAQGLGANWTQISKQSLGKDKVGSVVVLSALVRQKIKYPKLTPEERDEVLELVDEMIEWLRKHQLTDQDFIRQAIIDGLAQFRFRLERVRWLGYGYAIESLREVIGAYFALERGFVDDGSMPVVEATLKKVAEGVKKIYEKVGVVKEATEHADFLLKAYGAASLYANANAGGIAGLLTFGM